MLDLEEEFETHVFDKMLAGAIFDNFKMRTMLDAGCGDGTYTRYFLDKGLVCRGCDGSPMTEELTDGLCTVKDLTEFWYLGDFDLVLCLEVGEHIPKEYEQIFIDNLCRATKKTIILSWAVPGQGGTGHVNCQDNGYIIDKIKEKNFELNIELTQLLRDRASISWFKNTLMVFKHA